MTYNKICTFFCALIALTALTKSALAQDKIKVVTTFTIIADMAKQVAGDAAEITSITKPGAEIHDYKPTPQDIVRTLDADAIFWNGLNLERWFERFTKDIENVPQYIVTEGIEPLSIYEGPYSGKPNPHAWMSINNAKIYVRNIENALSELDPDNTALYHENANAYILQLNALKSELSAFFEALPKEHKYLVTSEGAFSYLAHDYDLKEIYLWPINAENQGSPQQVRRVIDTVRENKVPAVFSESTVSNKPIKQVAQETGAHYGGVLYVDSLSQTTGPVPHYIDLLRLTSQTIKTGIEEGLHNQKSKQPE